MLSLLRQSCSHMARRGHHPFPPEVHRHTGYFFLVVLRVLSWSASPLPCFCALARVPIRLLAAGDDVADSSWSRIAAPLQFDLLRDVIVNPFPYKLAGRSIQKLRNISKYCVERESLRNFPGRELSSHSVMRSKRRLRHRRRRGKGARTYLLARATNDWQVWIQITQTRHVRRHRSH